jgi:bacteriocin-like protein
MATAVGDRRAEAPAVDISIAKDDLMKTDKKLTLSKETLRTLDEKDLAQVVGGAQSGSNEPPRGGPNSCPNTKSPGCTTPGNP